LKILFFSHYFPPEVNAPATRVFQMGRRWVRAGHEVQVITCAPNVPTGKVYDGYRNRPIQHETVEGIRVTRTWTFLAPNKGSVRRSLNYISYLFSAGLAGLFTRNPDLIIATTPQFFCGWTGALVARLRRVPFVLEVRDLWPESIVAVNAMKPGLAIRFLGWLEQKLYAAAGLIVTVGDGYRSRLIERGVPSSKIAVITNGVDRETLKPGARDESLREKFGLAGKFVCAYVGTIGMACGLDVVLRAATLLKQQGRNDITFLLVGDGAVRDELQDQATGQELDNIIFAGLQPKPLIPALLATSDACLVHLRKQELFQSVLPSKLFEAAAMARPVILGVQGSAASLLTDMNGGICIEPENEEELCSAVTRLSDDPSLARRMGESACRHVQEHFDLDRLASDYLSLLEQETSR
jgi:glycosyltransferase involved in cell wall biosynthesis